MNSTNRRTLLAATLLTLLAFAAAACAGATSTSSSPSPEASVPDNDPGSDVPSTTPPADPDTPVSSPPGTATGDAAAGTQPAGQPLASGGTVTVELDPDGDGPEAPRTRTVTCPDDGSPGTVRGDDPFDFGGPLADAAAACAALADAAVQGALAPPPADQICTEIFGGPAVAHLTGEVLIGGDALAPVDRTVTRANGCEIAAWDALAPLVGPAPPFTE